MELATKDAMYLSVLMALNVERCCAIIATQFEGESSKLIVFSSS